MIVSWWINDLQVLHHWDFVFQLLLEHRLIVSPLIFPSNQWLRLVLSLCLLNNSILSLTYHIKTQWNCFPSFRDVWCTINTIIKCIIHLLITGYITKMRRTKSNLHINSEVTSMRKCRILVKMDAKYRIPSTMKRFLCIDKK